VGNATPTNSPFLFWYPTDFASACRLFLCIRIRLGWPESPPQRPPPSLARRRSWCGHGSHLLRQTFCVLVPAPLDLKRTATIRYPFGLSVQSTVDSWTWSTEQTHRVHRTRGEPHHLRSATCPPGQQPGVNPRSAMHILQISPWSFNKNNPQSVAVQNKFKSVLFLFG